MAPKASAQLLEVFDRVIGRNVHNLDADNVANALIAFGNADQTIVRPKIQLLLLRKVTDVLDELSTNLLCKVVGFFAAASKTNRNDDMLKIIEPYINSRMNGMSAENILDAIKGYYHANDPRQESMVALEQMLMDHLHQINIEFVGEILYFYTKNKVG